MSSWGDFGAALGAAKNKNNTPVFKPSTPNTTGIPQPTSYSGIGSGVIAGASSRPATPTFKPSTPAPTNSTVPQPTSYSGIGSAITAGANAGKPQTPVIKPPTPTPPKYNEAPQTQYVEKGGSALNQILYDKKQYDAGNKSWAQQNAQQYYNQLDPQTAEMVKNMNTQQLIDYINGLGKKETEPTPTPTFTPSTPTTSTPSNNLPVFMPPAGTAGSDTPQVDPYQPAIPVMDEDAIRKYAEEQVARKLADARLTADQAIANSKLTAQQQSDALKSNYDKLYETINEDRNVENVQNQRRLSPFSGRSDYALGMIEQNRARTDRENQDTLQTNQGNIAAQAAQLQQQINDKYTALANAAPDEREALFQSIKNDERQYDLMVHGQLSQDALTNSQLGNTAFNQALQQFQTNYQVGQDKIDNDANYGGTYNGGQSLQGQAQALAEKNANLNAALQYSDLSGQILSPQGNWGGYANQIAQGTDSNGNPLQPTLAGQQQMAQLTGYLPNGQKTTQQQQQDLQNLWQQADMTGTIPDQLAQLYGIPRGTQTQAAKQWAMNYSLQQDQFQSGIDQDLFNYQQGLNQAGQSGQASQGPSAADIVKTINSSPLLQPTTNPNNPDQSVPVNYSDPAVRNQLEAMIITQTQDPIVAVQLYNYYGIPVPTQLQQEYQQALMGKTGQ